VEREAIRAVTRSIPNSTTKSVKFAERPSLEQLLRQIELVTKCFQYIHSHDGDLDLQLTVTVHQPATNKTQHTTNLPAPDDENVLEDAEMPMKQHQKENESPQGKSHMVF
jgi:hypothetical protein